MMNKIKQTLIRGFLWEKSADLRLDIKTGDELNLDPIGSWTLAPIDDRPKSATGRGQKINIL
jgi:hypothetical protein